MDLSTLSTQQSPLRFLGSTFWNWYIKHEDDTWPVPVRFLGAHFTVNVKMETLKGLFEVIFGLNPHRKTQDA